MFDISLILRSRRRELRLRQTDLAKRAGVSRGFVIDLEHGKDSVELCKVLRVMKAMDVPIRLAWGEAPPAWAKPRLNRELAKERGWAEQRPRSWRQKLRPAPQPPRSWLDGGTAEAAGIDAARARIVRAIKGRGGARPPPTAWEKAYPQTMPRNPRR